MIDMFICDSAKKIADGKCKGVACQVFNDCYLTKDKEYAKEYISIYEAQKYFKDMIEIYIYKGDDEKAKQYANALKSVENAIKDLKGECEVKGGVYINSYYEQISLFEGLL